MTDVVELCRELHVNPEPGPLGVAFSWYFDRGAYPRPEGPARYRIEPGSGIAGRGNAWNVKQMPNGPTLGAKVVSRRALRSQILAALVEGPEPLLRSGFETYARWHTYGTTSSVQWFQRRKRRA